VLLTIASPGYNVWPLGYVALVPMLVAVQNNDVKPFLGGFIMGMFYYFYNMWWVTNAISHFGGFSLLISVPSLLFVAAYFALLMGVFTYLYKRFSGNIILIGSAFVCIEIVKGMALSGFPWLNLALTQTSFLPAVQLASVFGEYGVSFVLIIVNILIARAVVNKNIKSAFVSAVIIAIFLGFGFYRLSSIKEYTDTKKIRIAQTGVDQQDKWKIEKREEIVSSVNKLLRESSDKNIDLLVLPETSYPVFIQNYPEVIIPLQKASSVQPILIGAIRYEREDKKRKSYNSAVVFKNGVIEDTYDKIHLVPFGEYFPFKKWTRIFNEYFFKGADDFTRGTKQHIFDIGGMRIAPLICYEGAFTSLVGSHVAMGANLIVIVSNDSWFGGKLGMSQHLAVDVFRAVEFGRAIVRSTQSGISAFISPEGKIVKSIPVGVQDILDHDVPLTDKKTVYSRINFSWLLLFILVGVYIERRKKK